jgi:hypothetical protein
LNAQSLVTLVAAVLAFIASVLAATVAIYNARFTRFARERWWERKVDAYSKIIEALASLVYYYEEHLVAETEGSELSEEYRKQVGEHWRRGYAEVKRATAIGAFLVSDEADAALKKMAKERWEGGDPNNWLEALGSDYAGTRDCLKTVVAAAKKDIRVPWR